MHCNGIGPDYARLPPHPASRRQPVVRDTLFTTRVPPHLFGSVLRKRSTRPRFQCNLHSVALSCINLRTTRAPFEATHRLRLFFPHSLLLHILSGLIHKHVFSESSARQAFAYIATKGSPVRRLLHSAFARPIFLADWLSPTASYRYGIHICVQAMWVSV